MSQPRHFVTLGALSAMLAVALGAFGAHALEGRVDADLLEVYDTGVRYHLYHSLGLVIVGLLAQRNPEARLFRWSARLMATGIVLFSGSLYGMALTGWRWLGAVTPFGGVALLAAWLVLAWAARE